VILPVRLALGLPVQSVYHAGVLYSGILQPKLAPWLVLTASTEMLTIISALLAILFA